MEQFVTQYLGSFDSSVLKAAVVLVLYIVLAKVVDILTNKILRRLTKYTRSRVDDRILDLIHGPVFLLFL